MPVEIDDFCPNLVGAAHIWPQGFILKKSDCVRKALRILPCGVQGRLLFVFITIVISVMLFVVFVAVVIVGDVRKERGQLLGPNNCLPLLSGDAGALSVPSSPHNGQAACSPAGLATLPTVPTLALFRPRQALPRSQTQALPPTKQHPRQARQRQHQRSSRRQTQSPPPPRVQTHPCRDVPA